MVPAFWRQKEDTVAVGSGVIRMTVTGSRSSETKGGFPLSGDRGGTVQHW